MKWRGRFRRRQRGKWLPRLTPGALSYAEVDEEPTQATLVVQIPLSVDMLRGAGVEAIVPLIRNEVARAAEGAVRSHLARA